MTVEHRDRIEAVKTVADILDIANGYTELERQGQEYVGRCPLPGHEDRNPSFYVNPAKGVWNCRSACDRGGSVIDLVMDVERKSFAEALDQLHNRYGLGVDTLEQGFRDRREGKMMPAPKPKEKPKPKPKRVKNLGETGRWTILNPDGEYVSEHIRIEYELDDGERDKEVFWERNGKKGLDGIKTTDLPLYRSEFVKEWPANAHVIITEGEKAADALVGSGYEYVVATVCGANSCPSPEQLEVLGNFDVTIWRDADKPGIEHTRKLTDNLDGVATEVRVFAEGVEGSKDDAADHPAVISGNHEAINQLIEDLRQAPLAKDALPEPPTESQASGKKKGKKKGSSPADRIITYVLAKPRELFVDQFGAPHILWERDEPVSLTSSFDPYLRRLFYSIEDKAAGADAVKQARETLAAFALGSDNTKELHTRAAFHDGKLYYQLGVGRVIEIDRDGYRSTSHPPALFRTIKNLQPLPDPEGGGSFDVLRNWVNLKNTRDKRMYIAWLVTAAFPHIPRPMLEATGVMGSGKTTASRVAKRALDPTKPEAVRPDPREFLQKASHAHIVMLDNQNSLPEWMVDTLCRLVTGEADSKRVLYSDDEDLIYELKKAIILNGINAPTDRGDARDRTLPVELERIPETKYRPEEEMWAEFDQEHPRLLGTIFETLSQALRVKETLRLNRRARLADWSEYAAAVYEVLGWGAEKFTEDWSRVVKMQNEGTLEGSPVAQVIVRFMERHEEWEGLSTDLHAKLEVEAEEMSINTKHDKSWPKSPSWLWRRIKEVKPLLTALGIETYREVESSGTKVFLSTTTNTDPSGDDGPEGGNGGSKDENGSKNKMLPRMLPRPESAATAGSGSSGSTGSIPGHFGIKFPYDLKKEEANSPENKGNQVESEPENAVNPKVHENAATATTAATEDDPPATDPELMARIHEFLDEGE